MLFFNEKIYIAEYLSDGLSVSSIKNRMNSPNYAMRIYSEMASLDIPYLKIFHVTSFPIREPSGKHFIPQTPANLSLFFIY